MWSDDTVYTGGSRGLTLVCAAALACLAAAGCTAQGSARLWADTGGPDGFSYNDQQYSYDGQPVLFEFECEPSRLTYAVFGTGSHDTVVNTPTSAGRYRWSHAFSGGTQPTTYEVYATAFDMRGKCDWVYNKQKDTWEFYPGTVDKPDVKIAPDLVIKITCYRVEVHQKFAGRGGPPKQVSLTLAKPNGESVQIPQRRGAATDAPGFLLLGPDKDGAWEVSYTPSWKEVGRGGTTSAEIVVEHADGAVERLVQKLKTP
jgi:hypothetical protein